MLPAGQIRMVVEKKVNSSIALPDPPVLPLPGKKGGRKDHSIEWEA